MKFTSISAFALATMISFASIHAAAPDTSPPDVIAQVRQIEAAALQNRRAIKSGRFKMHHTLTDHRAGLDPKQADADERIETIIDGERVRENLIINGVRRSIAIGDPYLYFYSDERLDAGRRYGLIMSGWRAQPTIRTEYKPFQPLKLMFYPTWFRNADNATMDEFLGDALARTEISLAREQWNGEDTRRVSYTHITHMGSCRIEYRVVPRMGYGVVSMVARCTTGERHCNYAVEASLKEVAPGIWFPSHWRHSFKEAGNPILDDELSIDVDAINAPVDPAQFEPKSMGVPAGTFVIRSPSKGGEQYKWDGTSVVPITPAQARVMVFGTASKGLENVGWSVEWAVGGLLILSGIGVFWKVVRRWKRPLDSLGGAPG